MSGLAARPAGHQPADLPVRLTDQEFWRLTEDMSEPNGVFSSDNLLSNERVFGRLIPDLIARTKPGGVYLGVGPEQNFTYIAALRPRMAFITDIRRGNLHLQLLYKALFELSADRAEFVSRLFTKPRPPGLSATSTVIELMNEYWEVFTADEAAFAGNLRAVQKHLTETHAFPLPPADLDGIAAVYRAFYWYGPSITWSAPVSLRSGAAAPIVTVFTGNVVRVGGSTYRDIVTQTDANGQGLSFLATEEKFAFLQELQRRNLIVPVVGNFSGPKALRSIGAYLRERGVTVTAFYLSNVESYLQRAGTWMDFCSNVATMPLDADSLFIRPSGSGAQASMRLTAGLAPMATEVKACAK
jgi:hypothetical protein